MSLAAYILKRIISIIIVLFITTAIMYATVMLTPAQERATLFLPKGGKQTEEQLQHMIELIIEKNHLNDPFPIQYYYWISNLFQGNWGYSPTLQDNVFTAIMVRTPVTAELTLYSILAFIPLGILSGVIAGTRKDRFLDRSFRWTAYIATSLPPFILALILLATFYVGLYWFLPQRISTSTEILIRASNFHTYTGLLTIDGLLNDMPNVTLDAFRHLAMPVFTLAFAQWATLGRVTRVTMIEETNQDYVTAARARGLSQTRITWGHMLPNAIAPSLTSSLLSAASLITGVFVVEIIFNFHGVSEIAVASMQYVPDAAAALGFTIYSVVVVLILMTVLDLIQTILDPRIR